MPFADNDKTVFVARRPDGSIYGVWTARQGKIDAVLNPKQALEKQP